MNIIKIAMLTVGIIIGVTCTVAVQHNKVANITCTEALSVVYTQAMLDVQAVQATQPVCYTDRQCEAVYGY